MYIYVDQSDSCLSNCEDIVLRLYKMSKPISLLMVENRNIKVITN